LQELKDVQFLIQTGAASYGELVERFGERGEHHRLVPFIADMGEAYSASDIALSRAGGGGIAEMAALGVPPILVPLEIAADQHQRANANALVARDAAVLIEESDLNPRILTDTIQSLLGNPQLLETMRDNLASFARPDAAYSIIRTLNALEP
jgi:UDP-N-acetylglucosamine--N-acetylmuramyl-(pentapeptide) pyrophosphoryl-undecaprenol N-acetylglucosamine transferase